MSDYTNVPRELLQDATRSLEELAVAGEFHLSCQKGIVISCACIDCMRDRAVATHSKLRALLSAPPPTGADRLEVVAYTGQGLTPVCADELAKEIQRDKGVASLYDEPLCRLSDAQAIINQLEADNRSKNGSMKAFGQQIAALQRAVKNRDKMLAKYAHLEKGA